MTVGEAEVGHRAEARDRRPHYVLDGWSSPGWRDAAAEYHAERGRQRTVVEVEPGRLRQLRQLLDPNISFDRAYREINADRLRGRAAHSTVDALMNSLRRGIEAITEPDNQRRLAELSEDQLLAVCQRLQNFKPNIAPAWPPEEVEALASIWSTVHVSR
jgi:hypothetical protein